MLKACDKIYIYNNQSIASYLFFFLYLMSPNIEFAPSNTTQDFKSNNKQHLMDSRSGYLNQG